MADIKSFLRLFSKSSGEDPPKKNVFTSQEEINKANNWVKDFLARHGAPQYFITNGVVARKIGDPIPEFVYPNGKPATIDRPNLRTDLPFGVSINDVFQTKDGTYGFIHPQYGNWVQVDPQAIYQKYGGGSAFGNKPIIGK